MDSKQVKTSDNQKLLYPLGATTTPAVEVAETIIASVQEQQHLEKQTVVHCRLFTLFPTSLRIHPGTVLIDKNGKKSKLLTAHQIAVAPQWSNGCFEKGYHYFTLVFEGLDKACTSFHLQEIAAPHEKHLFYSDTIKRNKTDVYAIELKSTD